MCNFIEVNFKLNMLVYNTCKFKKNNILEIQRKILKNYIISNLAYQNRCSKFLQKKDMKQCSRTFYILSGNFINNQDIS